MAFYGGLTGRSPKAVWKERNKNDSMKKRKKKKDDSMLFLG